MTRFPIASACLLLSLRTLVGVIVPQTPLQSSGSLESIPARTRSIPGGSNFTYCSDNYASDLFQFSRLEVSFSPRIPTLGGSAFIKAEGTFSSNISSNANLGLVVEIQDGDLIAVVADSFCNVTGPIEQPHAPENRVCPPHKGKAIIDTTIPIDRSWPSGHWKVMADALDGGNAGKRIFCVRGELDVGSPSDEKSND